MPTFEHVSRYPHPRDEVFAWHTRPGAFVRLTPPGMATALRGPTDGIAVGSEIVLRISHPLVSALVPRLPGRGPLGLTWHVRHVDLTPGERFVDEQVTGPFRRWRHEHLFSDGPAGSTVITDRVHWELPLTVPGGVDRSLVEMQLDGLFRFRERQLRADLALHARLGAPPATVLVSGASGLIGVQLAALLTTGGHRVRRLVRRAPRSAGEVRWDPDAGVLAADAVQGVDAVAHLAGEPIAGRFTRRRKAAIMNSRVRSTTLLAQRLAARGPGITLVQASGINAYGARRPGELLTESSPLGEGFLADVVRAWEGAARPAVDAGVRTVLMRTGIVLSEGGGALARQVPLFSVGLGGRLTDADAWTSWISLDDAARGYVHALFTPELGGPVNLVAPRPATARAFAGSLGHVLHRPSAVPTPGFGPALLLGREGRDELVDIDLRVSAEKLSASGFEFAQGTLTDALRHALMR